MLVRQHIDIRTIQSRLGKGLYSSCFKKFFRDLLLLFNNFIISFRRSSQEYAAAQELRALVIKEMTDKLRKQNPITVTKPKPEQQQQQKQHVSLTKPNRASAMVVCGKRRSIKAISENAKSKKGDKKEMEVEEKPKVNEKKIDKSFIVGIEEKGVKKKRSQERSVSGWRNSTSSNKSSEVKHQYGGNELSSHDALEVIKKENDLKRKKKQGVASFLKRIKQNWPSEVVENDDDNYNDNNNVNDGDDSEDESKDSKVEEEKKRRSGRKRDVKREIVARSSRGRGVREESGRVKRGVGRPPKRSETMTGKRGRDNGESSDVGGGGGGKRTRR